MASEEPTVLLSPSGVTQTKHSKPNPPSPTSPAPLPMNAGIESLRALAIVAVVQLHCLRPFFEADNDPDTREDALRVVLDFATPSFFFMSGYLTRRPRGLCQPASVFALRRRLMRVWMPFAVASSLKFLLTVLSWNARNAFWQMLMRDLQLTHLSTPSPFRENCLLHEELGQYESYFRYDAPAPGPRQLLNELFFGTAFGFYYFPPVLLQMHLIAYLVFSNLNDSTLLKLVIFACFIWHPIRNDILFPVFGLFASFRLPFAFVSYFLFGYYARRCLVPCTQSSAYSFLHEASSSSSSPSLKRATKIARLAGAGASVAVFAGVVLALFCDSRDANARRAIVFFHDEWCLLFPPAVCLLWEGRGASQGRQLLEEESSSSRRSSTVLSALLWRPLLVARAHLSAFSYTIFLYHGFFLDRDWLPRRPAYVLAATVALSLFLRAVLKPEIATTYFGIAPPRRDSSSSASSASMTTTTELGTRSSRTPGSGLVASSSDKQAGAPSSSSSSSLRKDDAVSAHA